MPALARQGNLHQGLRMSNFEALKFLLITLTGLAKDALHIYIALAIFLGSCLIFGWKARQWRPWLLVLAVAITGEVWDILRALELGQKPGLQGNWQDIWNAMLIPTALLVLSRYSSIFAKDPAVSGPGRAAESGN